MGQIDSASKQLSKISDTFEGGRISFFNIAWSKLTYPSEVRQDKKFGNVYFTVTVDTNGIIKDIKIVKSFDDRVNPTVINALRATEGKWKVKIKDGSKEEYTVMERFYFCIK